MTIGFLARAGGGVGQVLWAGIVDAAREKDVNLVCFIGDRLRDTQGASPPANVIYDLMDSGMLDGIVSWASSVGGSLEHDEILDFHRRYHPLPVISIALPMKGIPTLLADSYEGMYETVVHLIEVHGHRRLAFVRGVEGHHYSEERYRAYSDALAAHAIPLDMNLVTTHYDFAASAGAEAIRLLLDERGLRPGVDFEAVVMVSDLFVPSALEELGARGVWVPGDIALVGFNNAREGRFVSPPLTTVRLPFYEQGKKAVEMLLALIEGKDVPDQVTLPSELVVRQSCGCKSLAVVQAAVREEIEIEIEQAMKELEESLDPVWAKRLLDTFVADSQARSTGTFLTALDGVLRQTATASDTAADDIAAVQNVISTLRRSLLPTLKGEPLSRAEDLWQQARVMIGEAVERARAYETLQVEQQAAVLREEGQRLLTTFNVGRLMDVLADALPLVGIPSAYLSLYEDPENPAGWARLVLACSKDNSGSRRIELAADGVRFKSPQLMPQELWSQEQRYSFTIRPLHFHNDQLGFILYEIGPRDAAVYDVLSTQISNALQGALLVQRVQGRSAELARQQYILDTFMENIPDQVYFKDMESRITRTNRAHAARSGLSDPADEVGKSDFDFFPEEQAQVKYEQEQEIIRTGQPILDLEESDEMGHWTLSTKMPLRDENGQIIGTFGISRDITAMKKAQAALEKAYAEVEQQVQDRTADLEREIVERKRVEEALARQAQMLDAELERFFFVASHHLQEPLRTVVAYSQFLQQRYQGELDEEADEIISYAIGGAARIRTLINDLLTFARVTTRGNPFEPTDSSTILNRVVNNLRAAIEGTGAEITHDSLPTVVVDSTQLTQVFRHILTNAIQFRGDRPLKVHVSARRGKDEWVFAIQDNGIGIEPQYLDRIFQIFERLHSDWEHRGTGIGLAICKKIVERHGGCIWVESEPGEGSTFYFTVPDREGTP